MAGDPADQDSGQAPTPGPVDHDAAQLRAVAHRIADLFPGEPRTTIDGRYDPHVFGQPARKHRVYGWEYNLRLSAPPDAAEILRTRVVPELAGAGWQVTDRSSDREQAYQFSRSGFNLGVHVARDVGGDVVIGGSTPPVPATD
ncbi:MAG: hypothetical protein ACRDUA_11730 [Micromonosporaceae bacterium]